MYVEFENGQKYSNKLADISDSHEAFRDAGWILEDDDYVIDIDDIPKDLIKKIISTFNIKTQTVWTDRGVHLYFKKPSDFKKGANRISPLGFKYEIKHKKNTKAVTIKRDGKLREIENEGYREDAPYIFSSNKQYEVLYGMDEGEGRNNSLFALRGKLAGVNDWRKIINFVNDEIFANPLEPQELDTITRDVVFEAEKDGEYEVASQLMNDLSFIEYGTRFYFKYDGEYTHEESLLKKKVYEKVGKQKTYYVDEVIKQMKYRCKKIPQDEVFNIKFKNGYLRDGVFVDLITDEFTPYQIDVEYDSETEPVKVVDDYIDHLTKGDTEYRRLLLEILGHCLVVDREMNRLLAKFFIFIGDGGNGKGTLLQIIKTILGAKNVSAMSISELSDERYLPSFKGKLANLGDDVQDQAINDKDMKALKNLSTADLISTRELYKGAEDMYFTGTLIFTSNHILKSWEKGESYKRRVLWLPMYTKVKKKDPKFISNLTSEEALKYWVKLMVDGYFRLYENSEFTFSQIVYDYNENYHKNNNPALEFIMDYDKKSIEGRPIREVYDQYQKWCEDNAVTYNENMVRNTIEEEFGLVSKTKRVNGQVTRCFLDKD